MTLPDVVEGDEVPGVLAVGDRAVEDLDECALGQDLERVGGGADVTAEGSEPGPVVYNLHPMV